MRHLYLLLLLACTLTASAQNPLIVKTVSGTNFEPNTDEVITSRVKPWNGKLFYQGKSSSTQCFLAVTDGTSAGTYLVADLGNAGGINGIFPAKDFVYIATLQSEFVSFSPITINWTRQLWKTDGTAAGTVLLKAFDQTTSTSNTGIFHSDALASVNYSIDGNIMYFNGFESAFGPELWRSDGTIAGTAKVKEIYPGSQGGNPFGFCKVGNVTCFFARDPVNSYQLWKTDGTDAGTQILTMINPSAQSIAEFVSGLYKGKMYFWANDGTTGAEVWYTDGTAAGTKLLKDFIPGNNAFTGSGGSRTDLTFIQDDNYLYFPIERSKYLWRTDGTDAGTIQLAGPMTSQNIAGAFARGNSLYWLDNTTTLYKTNGTVAGTSQVKNNLLQAVQLYGYKGAAWMGARGYANNSDAEPWRSDGTAANTNRAFDLNPGGAFGIYASSSPSGYFELNGYLYFFATNASGKHLYRYEGDMTFNGSVGGRRWADSSNWNSGMPPGITDTAYIGAGLTANITGTNAYAGTLIMNSGSSLQLTSSSDSLFIHKSLQGTSASGNGVVVLKNFNGDTSFIGSSFTANNINVQGKASVLSDLSVNNNLNLTANARLLSNNANVTLNGASSTVNGDASNYIVTNGTGSLQIQSVGTGGRTGNVIFPIGTSGNYNPVTLSNSGAADAFSARVQEGISVAYTGETPSGGTYSGGAVNATWMIREAVAGGSNATIGLQWNASQELSGFDRSASRLGHYTGGSWQLGAPGNASGSNPYSWSGSGYTSFSPFGILNTNSVLPVYKVSLSIQKEGSRNRLLWTIIADGAETIALERSTDGRQFATVHSSAYSATGSFADAVSAAGNVYYRLKVADSHGSFKYSNTVWVSRDDLSAIAVYPTLFQSSFYVQYNGNEGAVLKLFGGDGSLLLQQMLKAGTNEIFSGKMSKGVIYFQVLEKGKMLKTGQLMKQ